MVLNETDSIDVRAVLINAGNPVDAVSQFK